MALDRWIALVLLLLCLAYGYAAFFTMDQLLPPFMQRNPVWPSTFPKMLAVLGVIVSLVILLGLEKPAGEAAPPEIDHRRLGEYHLGQALALLGLMVAYALLLRPAGFVLATIAFLSLGAVILGERRFPVLLGVTGLATGLVWFLVDQVLGIYLRPLPMVLTNGGG